jgi:hypothetical protein
MQEDYSPRRPGNESGRGIGRDYFLPFTSKPESAGISATPPFERRRASLDPEIGRNKKGRALPGPASGIFRSIRFLNPS